MRVLIVLVLSALVLSGCPRQGGLKQKAGPVAEEPVALDQLTPDKGSEPIDWDTPLQERYWGSVGPLEMAAGVAQDGRLDCLALAPDPLKLASLQEGTSATLSDLLEGIGKKLKPLQVERHPDWLLLYFGTAEDLKRVKGTTEGELPPLMVSASTSCGLLRLIAATWGLDLRVEPSLVQRRDELLEEQRREFEEQLSKSGAGRYYASAGMFQIMSWDDEDLPMAYGPYGQGGVSTSLSFTVKRRTSVREVLERAAVTLGGECKHEAATWLIRRRVDGQQLAAEVDRLMGELQNEGSADETDTVQALIVMGEAAVPKLKKALDPQQPAVAAKAALALAELKAADAAPAIIEAWRKAPEEHREEWEYGGGSPKAMLMEAMGKLGGPQIVPVLVEAATDRKQPSETRTAAREALMKLGALDALAPDPQPTIDPPSKRFRFALRGAPRPPSAPAAPPGPDELPIDAKCKGDDGRHWALFRSPALGNAADVWLATSPDGKTWQEFLFTGLQDPTVALDYRYGYGSGSSNSKWRIEAAKGVLTVTCPTSRYYSSPGNKPIVRRLKEADLRLDSDQDGLTEPVEKRLGTSPSKPDTDGDTIPDGTDGNPLAPPSEKVSDRDAVLQQLFTYLLGGDPGTELLVIRTREPLAQEFHGYAGPVVVVSDDVPRSRRRELTRGRVLWLGGSGSAEETVLTVDGPVGFNESRTKAEVRFRLADKPPSRGYRYESYYASGSAGEKTALFSKGEKGWVLTKVLDVPSRGPSP